MNCSAQLAIALQKVAAGLADAANHYFLKANYYDHVGGDEVRWWLAIMWLHTDTTRNFVLSADALQGLF